MVLNFALQHKVATIATQSLLSSYSADVLFLEKDISMAPIGYLVSSLFAPTHICCNNAAHPHIPLLSPLSFFPSPSQ
jgi:hypothetical protein